MPGIEDEFEAFRKKKVAEEVNKKAHEEGDKFAPKLDPKDLEGRPKGFRVHRHGFNQGKGVFKAVKEEDVERPKGFSTHHVADPKDLFEAGHEPGPRPPGFATCKIGPGIPKPKEETDES